MENIDLKFKTNLNCGACVARVKPALDEAEGLAKWEVDTNNADKILTVSSQGITAERIIQIIKSRGFNIERI